MTIPTPSLKRLAEQVQDAVPEAKIEYGDIDGIDRYRSVSFDAEGSAYLLPLLPAMADPRIDHWDVDDDGDVTVTVVALAPADFAHDFALTEAAEVIHDVPKGQPGNPYSEEDAKAHTASAHDEEEGERPRKRAAKKAAQP